MTHALDARVGTLDYLPINGFAGKVQNLLRIFCCCALRSHVQTLIFPRLGLTYLSITTSEV